MNYIHRKRNDQHVIDKGHMYIGNTEMKCVVYIE